MAEHDETAAEGGKLPEMYTSFFNAINKLVPLLKSLISAH